MPILNRRLFILAISLLAKPLYAESGGVSAPRVFDVTSCQSASDKLGESCLWWYRSPTDVQDFTVRKPTRLVIYFAGGEQSCASPGVENPSNLSGYGGLADSYVRQGFTFVCANLFSTLGSPGASKLPYHKESDRANRLVRDITTKVKELNLWNGQYLLFSGVSHGSITGVLSMYREEDDETPAWKGTKKTGACFLDGQYDALYNQSFWMQPENIRRCDWFLDRTICQRYLGVDECSLPQTGLPDLRLDSIIDTNAFNPSIGFIPNNFAIKDWKIVECGDKLPACPGSELLSFVQRADFLPAAPQEALCKAIGSSRNHQCEFQSYPLKSHMECGLKGVADDACIGWFNDLIGE